MAEVKQVDEDAQYWLDCFSGARDKDEARRYLNAFLGELYRLYCATWPEGVAKGDFFRKMQSDERYLRLDVLTMLVRGAGVHDLRLGVEAEHAELYPSSNLYPGPYTFPGPQYHFPDRHPDMGRGVRNNRREREDGYDRLIRGAPVLPTIYGALMAVRSLLGNRAAAAS